MISSVFTLKNSYVPEELVTVKTTNLSEGYHMNSTLDFLVESHKSLLSHRQDFYRSIVESSMTNNKYTIDESFNEVIYNIKNIIQKNIEYLDTCVKRFETQLCKYVDSDKYIMKKKEELKKFPSGASFDTTGYEFTFKDNIPTIDIVGLDLSEIKDELKNISDKDIISKLAKLSELLTKLSDQQFDQVCGEILGCEPITQVDFTNSVFSVYRDGKSEESTLNIGREEVLDAVNNYGGYKDMIKQIKGLQNEIVNKYKTLEAQIDEIIKSNLYLDGNTRLNTGMDTIKSFSHYKSKLSTAIDELTLSLTNRIQKISTLHLQAFAGKLDACNSKIMQDRSILYSALNVMQSTDVEEVDESAIDFTIEERSYDYTRDAAIYDYMVEMYELDLRQERFVDECFVLMEGNISELKTINEALKMDKQNIFDRIKAFIKRIFEKFTMKLNKLIHNNKDFLIKYENIIKRVKIEDFELNDVPNYEAGIKNIKDHKMPHLDIKTIVADTEDAIKQKLLPAYKGTGEFKDVAKRYFLCDNEKNKESVQSEALKMADIYEFCKNAPSALNQLKSDKDFVIKESDLIKTKVLAAINGRAQELINAAEKAAEKPTEKRESVDLSLFGYHYSSVLEMFINEDEEQQKDSGTIKADDDNKNNTSSNDNKDTKMDLNIDREAQDHKDLKDDVTQKERKDREGKEEDDAKKQAEENKDAEAKKVKETAEWYIQSLKDLYAAKITSFQRIYQEYMKILRYHVKRATKNKDASVNDFSDEDQKQITDAMKEYVTAKKEGKDTKSAVRKIKNVYTSKNLQIDDHDVETLIKKNQSKIEKMLSKGAPAEK